MREAGLISDSCGAAIAEGATCDLIGAVVKGSVEVNGTAVNARVTVAAEVGCAGTVIGAASAGAQAASAKTSTNNSNTDRARVLIDIVSPS